MGFEQLAALKTQLNQSLTSRTVASRSTHRLWTSSGKSSSHRNRRERPMTHSGAQLPRGNDIFRTPFTQPRVKGSAQGRDS